MVDNDSARDDVLSEYERRASNALADLERRALAARDAITSASTAEAVRFEKRVEGWSTWQTVAAALVALGIGVVVGLVIS